MASVYQKAVNGFDFFEAIRVGDHEAVARLLATDPKLIGERGAIGLQSAIANGHDLVVAQLLAARPELIRATDMFQRSALHLAAGGNTVSHKHIATRLLAARPGLVDAVDEQGWTALHSACFGANAPAMIEMLVALKPDLPLVVNNAGNTPLHFAAQMQSDSSHVVTRLLELNPAALHAVNNSGKTPFSEALTSGNNCAIEAMQLHLSIDAIRHATTTRLGGFARFQPVVESQCVEPLLRLLSQDVAGIVFAYLGVEAGGKKRTTTTTTTTTAAQKQEEEEEEERRETNEKEETSPTC